MPVERQAERLRTPLAERDRRLLAVLGVVALLAVIAGSAYAIVHGKSTQLQPGCVAAVLPFSMGGVTVHRCGADAAAFCRKDAPGHDDIVKACRRAGYAVAGGS